MGLTCWEQTARCTGPTLVLSEQARPGEEPMGSQGLGHWMWGVQVEVRDLARSLCHPHGSWESGACGLGFPWNRVGMALAQWMVEGPSPHLPMAPSSSTRSSGSLWVTWASACLARVGQRSPAEAAVIFPPNKQTLPAPHRTSVEATGFAEIPSSSGSAQTSAGMRKDRGKAWHLQVLGVRGKAGIA